MIELIITTCHVRICKLTTVRAAERLLPRVRPLVTLKQPRSTEGLAAHGALVLEVVRQQVHAQRVHAHVDLQRERESE